MIYEASAYLHKFGHAGEENGLTLDKFKKNDGTDIVGFALLEGEQGVWTMKAQEYRRSIHRYLLDPGLYNFLVNQQGETFKRRAAQLEGLDRSKLRRIEDIPVGQILPIEPDVAVGEENQGMDDFFREEDEAAGGAG